MIFMMLTPLNYSVLCARATIWFYLIFFSYAANLHSLLESDKGLASVVLQRVWTSGWINEYITFWKVTINPCMGKNKMVFACH